MYMIILGFLIFPPVDIFWIWVWAYIDVIMSRYWLLSSSSFLQTWLSEFVSEQFYDLERPIVSFTST